MGCSRKWASLVSLVAAHVYFGIIILQVPLFRVPCRAGKCTTPMEVTCTHLLATRLIPPPLVKALLYPGAVARALFDRQPFPTFDSLLTLYNFTIFDQSHNASYDLYLVEVVAGSYLSVAGAVVGSLRTGRISLAGMMLLVWGIGKEVFVTKPITHIRGFHIYPTIAIALLAAFLSIRKDVRNLLLSSKPKKH